MTENLYTSAAVVHPFGITIYVFNDKYADAIEFIELENRAMMDAILKHYYLNKTYETFETDVELRVWFN